MKLVLQLTILSCFGWVSLSAAAAQDPSKMEMPKPEKAHAWLKQLEGDWVYDSEAIMPGMPAMKSTGTDTTRAVGGFWVVSENKGKVMDQDFTGLLTLGYDPEKKKYVGTWVDSMNSHLVVYEDGKLEGNKLTMSCKMPNPMLGGKICQFRDVLEVKGKDEKTLTSSMLGDDGKWTTFLTINYKRKK